MTFPAAAVDRDWQIRLAAFAHIAKLGGEERIVRWADLEKGFEFEGETIFLVAQSGIFRPRQLRGAGDGPALTIRTTPPDSRYGAPYDDQLRAEDEFVHYRYRKGGPDGSDNRSLRRAMEMERPLIWFYGLSEGLYRAEYPVWVVNDLREATTFELAVDSEVRSATQIVAGGSSVPLKAYATVVAKRRLHQARFREMVLGAYGRRCTVCSIGAKDRLVNLLDAAHIKPDRDEQGLPEIPNGLSLCKIHHSAYDLNILGIDPEYVVRVNADILEEKDGPMLQHGIKGMNGVAIGLPRRKDWWPNVEFLAERFRGFRAA